MAEPTTPHSPDTVPRPKVLYVDDQRGNLTVFRANLKKYADITTTTSVAEALQLLRDEEFPIIISDQRMDEMLGASFLAKARDLQPASMRMLLTAYSDFDAIVEAINAGQICRFIKKPWEREDLLATLIHANELYWRRKENEALTRKLLHRERLAAIGQVTAGIVHELGNMANKLSVADEIREFWNTDEDLTREFEILNSGVQGIRLLLETLRLYSKGGTELEPVRRAVELNALVDNWMTMLRLFPHVKDVKSLRFSPYEEPIRVAVDVTMIEQVMVNLVKNGAEAAGPGGDVHLTLGVDGERAFIHVQDTGPGVPDEAASRIWDGFYSTKGEHGTGLGLMMCRRIVDAHGGDLSFVNLPEGCRFTLALPLTA